jgi:hypothetical protein
MSVGEISSLGEFQFDFSESMLLPSDIESFDYSSIFHFMLSSDDSDTLGVW